MVKLGPMSDWEWRWKNTLPPDVKRRYERRFRYLRTSFGFSEWEAEVYAKINPKDKRLKEVLGYRRWVIREAAAYQGISEDEAAALMTSERDAIYDALNPGDLIPDDFDPYIALGYLDEDAPKRRRPRKIVYA